jgi:outer membrane protein TolC
MATMLAAGVSLAPEHARAESLDQALSGLLEIHPRMDAAENTRRAAEAGVDVARDAFLPRASVSGQGSYDMIDKSYDGSTDEFNDTGAYQATGTASLNLFSGFRDSARLGEARAGADIAGIDVDDTRRRVIYEGISAYVTLAMQRDMLSLSRGEEVTATEQLSVEQRRLDQGSGVSIDVLVARQRLQQVAARRIDAEAGYNDALIRYTRLFQSAPDIAAMETPAIPADLLPSGPGEAVDLAMRVSPDMRRANRDIDRLGERRRQAESGYYPSVDLFSELSHEEDFDGSEGWRRDGRIGVRANWEIFSGFQTRDSVRAATFERAAGMDNARYVADQVEQEAELAWNDWVHAGEREEVAREALDFANELAEQREALAAGGKETRRGVLEAETRIFGAKADLITAQYSRILAAYRLAYSVGRLDAGAESRADAAPDVTEPDAETLNQDGAITDETAADAPTAEGPRVTQAEAVPD